MDFRKLEYVVAVADTGSFTDAADATHVSQPSLSQAVRSLERELGVELFHRTSAGVRLTAAGEALLEPARQALRDAETARAAVAAVAGVEAGRLDLVCLPTLAAAPAAELIGRFRRHHPHVAVRLAEPDEPDAVPERVRDGSCEIGVAELPIERDDLDAVPLGRQEFVALMHDDLAAALGRSTKTIGLHALAEQPLITTPPGTSTRRQLDDGIAAAGLDITIAVETENREAIAALVAAGAGVAVVPRPVAERAQHADLQIRQLSPSMTRQIGLLTRPGPKSPAAERFIELSRA